jgi:formylglycine-generating enzyme required for sulfatase activity
MNSPKGADEDTRKALRGGSWVGDETKVRITNRRGIGSHGIGPYIGFRIVMTD